MEGMGQFRGWRIVGTLAIVCLIAAVSGGGWMLWRAQQQIDQMERQRMAAAAEAKESQRRLAMEMEQLSQAASSARHEASEALRNAVAAAEGRTLAEQDAVAAREQAAAAQQEAAKSGQSAAQAREELEALRQRRQEEMDRMQAALARIAKTRRTTSGMVVELAQESFQFDFDSSDLRPANRELLSRIAGVLLASKGYRLAIHGYTDDVGTPQYNQQLSQRRAEAVASYLEKCGVAEEVLTTHGYGKSSPRAEGTDSTSRQKNRRVEIAIVDSIIDYQGVPRNPSL